MINKKIYAKYERWFKFFRDVINDTANENKNIDLSERTNIQPIVDMDYFKKMQGWERKLIEHYGSTWRKIEDYHWDNNLFYTTPLNEEELSLLYHKLN